MSEQPGDRPANIDRELHDIQRSLVVTLFSLNETIELIAIRAARYPAPDPEGMQLQIALARLQNAKGTITETIKSLEK